MAKLAKELTPVKSNSTTISHDHFSTVSVDVALNTTPSIVFIIPRVLELQVESITDFLPTLKCDTDYLCLLLKNSMIASSLGYSKLHEHLRHIFCINCHLKYRHVTNIRGYE